MSHFKAKAAGLVVAFALSCVSSAALVASAQQIKRYKPELVVQSGHKSNILFLRFSPDGRFILSGDGRTTKLWDAATGMELRTLAERSDRADIEYGNLSFSADSRYLVDGFTVTDVFTGKLVRAFAAPAPVIGSTRSFLSRDGKLFASAWNQHATVWDGQSGRFLRSFDIHLATINSAKLLVAGYGKPAEPPKQPVDPNADIVRDDLVPERDDHAVHVFSLATGAEVARLDGFKSAPERIEFSPDGSRLVAIGRENISVWDIGQRKLIDSVTTLPNTLIGLLDTIDVSPNGDAVLIRTYGADSNTSHYSLWPVGKGSAIEIAHPNLSWANGARPSVFFDPKGGRVALSEAEQKPNSNFRRSTVRIFSNSTTAVTDTIDVGDVARAENAGAVTIDETGKFLAVGRNNEFELWDLTSKQLVRRFEGHTNDPFVVSLATDGSNIAVANTMRSWWADSDEKEFRNQNAVMLWPLAVEETPKTLRGFLKYTGIYATEEYSRVSAGPQLFNSHNGYLSTFMIPQFGTLAARSEPETADATNYYFWDVATGQPAAAINDLVPVARKASAGYLFSAEPSPDGKLLGMLFVSRIAKQGEKESVTFQLWSVEEKRSLWSAEVPIKEAVQFASDGSRVRAGSVWFSLTGTRVQTPKSDTLDVVGNYGTFKVNGRLLGGQISTGRVGLFDAETRSKICDLYWIDKDDWAVITPSGLFDGTDGAQAAMHFEVSDPAFGYETISLEQLKSSYYVPGLLHKLLYKPLDIPKVGELSIALPPSVTARSVDGTSQVRIDTVDRGGGIGRIEVRVNGAEVTPDARTGNAATAMTVDLSSKLRSGENKVEIIPWNGEGNVRGRSVTTYVTPSTEGVTIKGFPGIKPDAAKKTGDINFYAIISGIADYQGSGIDLRFAARDAENMAMSLSLAARKYFCADEMAARKPCDRVHIRVLSTEQNKDAQFAGLADVPDLKRLEPVKQGYIDAFTEVAQRARPEDVVFVYMSGHGTAITSEQAVRESAFPDMYLYPTRDASTLDREVMSNPSERNAKAVSSLELAKWLSDIKADKRVMVLDTCAAGAIQKNVVLEARAADPLQIRSIDRLRERSGFYILMGAAADKQSFEANEFRQGLLTYSLIQAMTVETGLREGRFIDVENWFKYAEDNVGRLASGIGGVQKPSYFKSNYSSSFDIGRVDQEEQRLIPLSQPVPLILHPILNSAEDLTDSAGLSDLVEAKLLLVSAAGSKGASSAINYITAAKATGGVSPRGLYTINGDSITVNLSLIKNETRFATLTVTAKRDEIADKLVEAILASLSKR